MEYGGSKETKSTDHSQAFTTIYTLKKGYAKAVQPRSSKRDTKRTT